MYREGGRTGGGAAWLGRIQTCPTVVESRPEMEALFAPRSICEDCVKDLYKAAAVVVEEFSSFLSPFVRSVAVSPSSVRPPREQSFIDLGRLFCANQQQQQRLSRLFALSYHRNFSPRF